MNIARQIQKIVKYEYWPWYMLYIPLLPIYFFGVFRTRKWLYFTAANPGIEMGGFFGEKKDEILSLISDQYKAKSISVRRDQCTLERLQELMAMSQLEFPIIAKPNVGERGFDVKVITNNEELNDYHLKAEDYILQEFVNFPLELGVLYFKYPNESKGRITSITEKEFLSVEGNGVNTVQELLESNSRGRLYTESLTLEYADRLRRIPKMKERFVVHQIGNHSKGTKFIDANRYITQSLNTVFDNITKDITGVFFGRYDLKVPSYTDLAKGENIKIFELNGVSSEPGHLYDQSTVFHAYIILAKHWMYIIKIARQNIGNGVTTTPFSYFLDKIKGHFIS